MVFVGRPWAWEPDRTGSECHQLWWPNHPSLPFPHMRRRRVVHFAVDRVWEWYRSTGDMERGQTGVDALTLCVLWGFQY